jgi:dolichol-phosphate mannosyltransferase
LSFRKSLHFALDGLTSFSFFPLRVLALTGWGVTVASFMYGAYALAIHLFTQTTIPGWTSVILCLVFLSGFQIAVNGMLGEYLGRVLEQVKGRPAFIVREAVGLEPLNTQRTERAALPLPYLLADDLEAEAKRRAG